MKLIIEERYAPFLRPVRIVGPIPDASSRKQLGNRLVVKVGILPDIQSCKVKSEDFKFMPERTNMLLLNQRASVGDDTFGDQFKIVA